MLTVRDVALAAYCPRKLYYRRREPDVERSPPAAVEAVRDLAFDYPALLADASRLQDAPIEECPAAYQSHLRGAKARLDAWDALAMGGQVVTLTTHHERSFAPPLRAFVERETTIHGSRYATKDEVVRAARLLADSRVTWR